MSLLSDWFNKRVIGPAYEGVKALDSMTGGPEYRKRNAPMWQAMAQDAGDVLKAPFVELPPERKERLYDNIGNMISPQTGMFIGPKAVLSSTEQKALKKAMMMRAQGKTRDETMAGTDGWFWLKDGKFRKEINDSGADYLPHKLPKYNPDQAAARVPQDHALLSDVYKHPELYQRYPAMANDRVIPLDPEQVYLGVNYGRWEPTGRGNRELAPYNTIGMQHPGGPMGLTSKELAGVINHEVTHSIQGTERYTSGGNPESIIGQLMRDPEYAKAIAPLIKEAENDPKAYQDLKNNLYRALLSEEEANLSQTRRNYSPVERKIVPPWSDFQYPEAAHVVIDRNTGDVAVDDKGDARRNDDRKIRSIGNGCTGKILVITMLNHGL